MAAASPVNAMLILPGRRWPQGGSAGL